MTESQMFWGMTPYSLVDTYWRFRRTSYLRAQSRWQNAYWVSSSCTANPSG